MPRLALLTACLWLAVGVAPVSRADPPADPPAPPPAGAAEVVPVANSAPVDTGAVASEVPGIATTLDGRTITVAAKDEYQYPVPPLTTSLSSRDWIAGGTFTGSTTGDVAGGSLEVGYQIGCGVEMDKVQLGGTLTGVLGNTNFGAAGVILPPSRPHRRRPRFLASSRRSASRTRSARSPTSWRIHRSRR